jgi:hypothetical protein
MAAFKQYAAFGFWKQTLLDNYYKVLRMFKNDITSLQLFFGIWVNMG